MDTDFFISLLNGTIRTSAPILLAALGQVYTQKSGILDLSVEGTMTISALAGFIVTFVTTSTTLGLIAAMMVGMLYSSLMAFLSITVKANQVIAGTALTMLGSGLASFIYRIYFGIRDLPPVIISCQEINFGFLSKIPFIGPVLFTHNITIYIALTMVFVTWFVMKKTVFGLQVHAVGELPRAADSKGIHVNLVRFICVMIGGAYSGIAGASLSLGFMNTYTDHMIAGRGFIAIAVVVFARWMPKRVLGAALLFGGANTLQMRLQAIGVNIPNQALQALPYLLTIIVLLGVSKHVNFPSAFTVAYNRNEK